MQFDVAVLLFAFLQFAFQDSDLALAYCILPCAICNLHFQFLNECCELSLLLGQWIKYIGYCPFSRVFFIIYINGLSGLVFFSLFLLCVSSLERLISYNELFVRICIGACDDDSSTFSCLGG